MALWSLFKFVSSPATAWWRSPRRTAPRWRVGGCFAEPAGSQRRLLTRPGSGPSSGVPRGEDPTSSRERSRFASKSLPTPQPASSTAYVRLNSHRRDGINTRRAESKSLVRRRGVTAHGAARRRGTRTPPSARADANECSRRVSAGTCPTEDRPGPGPSPARSDLPSHHSASPLTGMANFTERTRRALPGVCRCLITSPRMDACGRGRVSTRTTTMPPSCPPTLLPSEERTTTTIRPPPPPPPRVEDSRPRRLPRAPSRLPPRRGRSARAPPGGTPGRRVKKVEPAVSPTRRRRRRLPPPRRPPPTPPFPARTGSVSTRSTSPRPRTTTRI
mmetsp:Transcript_3105/g.13997  ORF Transcript_3105/g.13997 Transcript_3105/m.13997 type:complete len:331 (+) Transcript_3105:1047-2039(+)